MQYALYVIHLQSGAFVYSFQFCLAYSINLILQPAVSGLYTFYMTCEDECELWLKEADEPTLNDERAADNEGKLVVKLPTRTERLMWNE